MNKTIAICSSDIPEAESFGQIEGFQPSSFGCGRQI